MDYKIISAKSTDSLEEIVKSYLEGGYIPSGGVTIFTWGGCTPTYMQVVYKV